NPIKKLFKKTNKESIVVEKTIIRPTFSYIGRFYISKNAINQIVFHELSEFEYISKINYVKFDDKNGNLEIKIGIEINLFEGINTVFQLQKHIIKAIYKTTLINVSRLDISINKIKNVK
ncbi:MAG: ATP-binding protein, partial [Peptostreptococcaceae bacterium]